MKENKDPRRNESGCLDLTAYNALRKEDEHERFENLLHNIKDMCEDACFKIEGRIVLVDMTTGKVWR
jgi:hypothetical protein